MGNAAKTYGEHLDLERRSSEKHEYLRGEVWAVAGGTPSHAQVVNSIVIVEVLSDSTEASDRGEKFAHLQRIPSLKEYVLVSQREQRIEVFPRGEGTTWTFLPFTSGRVDLKSTDASLELAEAYAAEVYTDPTA